jgi:thiol-disulfide isomerase/thioredoxin
MMDEAANQDRGPSSPSSGPSFTIYVLATLLSAIAGFAAVYWTILPRDNGASVQTESSAQNAPAAVPSGPLPSGPGTNALSTGQMAAFVFKKTPEPVPDLSFVDASGRERTLKDWTGKVVLLNVWATWCAPCRKEMPALDRLEQQLGGEDFQVLAISVDKSGIEGARKFFKDIKVEKLDLYADPTLRLTSGLKVVGMPTTLLIGRGGREIGRLAGAAEWDGEDAQRLIRAALSASPPRT